MRLKGIWFFVSCFCVCFENVWTEFEPGGKPQAYIINPEAESIIGASVNVRRKGAGLFGCGDLIQDGINTVDALQWATNNVNNRLWSGSSSNISLGVHVMDSCGRTRIATLQLADFLPKARGEDVSAQVTTSTPLKIGLIDGVGLDNEPDVTVTVKELNLPMSSTTGVEIVSHSRRSEAVVSLAVELGWAHVVLVHTNSPRSMNMLRSFTRVIRKKPGLCLNALYNVQDDKFAEEIFEKGLPVIALLPSEQQDEFFNSMSSYTTVNKTKEKLPVLFADLVHRSSLKSVPRDNIYVLSLVLLPDREAGFEEYRARHTIFDSFHPEDELELAQRTNIARNVQYLVDKLSAGVSDVLSVLCEDEGLGLCPRSLKNKLVGDTSLWERLSTAGDFGSQFYFGLVEYQFRMSDGNVHLHKIMSVSQQGNIDVYDTKYPSLVEDVCRYNRSDVRCRCLHVTYDRADMSRHIGHVTKSKTTVAGRSDKPVMVDGVRHSGVNVLDSDYIFYLPAEVDRVHKQKTHPSLYTSLRDPVSATLAGLTLIGALLTLLTGQYFATSAAQGTSPITSGTSVLGYLILIGLFTLYSANVSLLFVPSTVTCATRRLLPSVSYAIVFSAMLIKVWTTFKQTRGDKSDKSKPTHMIMLALCLTMVQILLSGLWLVLVPPLTHYNMDTLSCYPSSNELDSHMLLSMTYVVVLLFTTAVLALRTCSKTENSESRWILMSSGLVAITFFSWGLMIATGVLVAQRAAAVNVVSATVLLFCIYIPKLKLHMKLKRTPPQFLPYPTIDFNKTFPTYTSPTVPVGLKYSPGQGEDRSDSMFSNQDYSNEGGTESISIPFEIDTSSFSDIETEPYRFSTFLEDPQPLKLQQCENKQMCRPDSTDYDPTQVVPSTLYPLDMFSTDNLDDCSEIGEHCIPGSNEFTTPNLVCLKNTEWMP